MSWREVGAGAFPCPPEPKADWIRTVPELAARLALGAEVMVKNSGEEPKSVDLVDVRPAGIDDPVRKFGIGFEGHFIEVESPEVLEEARRIAATLPRPPGLTVDASFILRLRFLAEEAFLARMLPNAEASVLMFPVPGTAAGYYRMALPSIYMRERARVVAQWAETLDPGKAMRFDALWLQLETSEISYQVAKAAKENGVKVIFDMDDDFESIPPWHPLRKYHNTEEKKVRFWKIIELADCVTVCSEPLAEKIRPRTRRVEVIPYCVPASLWPARVPKHDGLKRILWVGSASHDEDLQMVAPALMELCRRREDVRVVCCGARPPDSFRPLQKLGRLELHPWGEFLDMPERIAELGADIAIVPLRDVPFNRCKSGLKVLEHICWGHFVLASPVCEYPGIMGGPSLRAARGGMLVPDDGWLDALKFALDSINSELAGAIIERGRKWAVENRDCEARINLWEDLVISLKKGS